MTRRYTALALLLAPLAACHAPAPASPAAPELVIRSAPPSPPSRDPLRILPGESVGPIRLGMRRDEVEALGVLRKHPTRPTVTLPYQVAYDDDGRVGLVSVSLVAAPADVRVGEVVLPRGIGFAAAHAILGDCTEPEVGFGGGGYLCRGGLVQVTGGSGSPDEIWVGTHARR